MPEEAAGLQVVAPDALPADVDPALEGDRGGDVYPPISDIRRLAGI